MVSFPPMLSYRRFARLTLLLCTFTSAQAWAADLSTDQANLLQGAAATGDANALQQLRAAAAQGDVLAEYDLGTLYADGRGVTKDPGQADLWFRKAANQGYAIAQYRLGRLYDATHGGISDDAQAAAWYQKAADQGLAEAQNDLGTMYANGQGVPQDYLQAIKWLTLAKQSGDPLAAPNLQQCLDMVSDKDAAKAQKMANAWWAAHHRGN